MAIIYEIILKSRERLLPISISLLRASLPFFFSMMWPFIVIRLFGPEQWGDAVDAFLYLNFVALIIAWGNRRYFLKKVDLMPAQISEIWLESVFARSALLAAFLGFTVLAPIAWDLRFGFILIILCRFIYNSYEPVIEYKKRYTAAIIAETLGFVKCGVLIFSLRSEMDTAMLILCLAMGEVLKTLMIIILVRDIRFLAGFPKFNVNYYIQSFPFFILGFATTLMHVVDRIFVYILFPNADRAFYQIYMNMMLFIISIPGFLLIPFLKNYYRSKLRLNLNIRNTILLSALLIIPVTILFAALLCTYFYRFEVPLSFLFWGGLFLLPSFVYAPIIFYLVGKNQYFTVSSVIFTICVVMGMSCRYFISRYHLEGAIVTATLGQWLLMLSALVIYFQEKNAKKIRWIK